MGSEGLLEALAVEILTPALTCDEFIRTDVCSLLPGIPNIVQYGTFASLVHPAILLLSSGHINASSFIKLTHLLREAISSCTVHPVNFNCKRKTGMSGLFYS